MVSRKQERLLNSQRDNQKSRNYSAFFVFFVLKIFVNVYNIIMGKKYDIVIIGGGPAGVSAGIYASRAGRSVLIIEKYAPGGQLSLIGQIENYAGFKSINGYELAVKFEEHAKSLGIEFCIDEVVDITKSREDFFIKTLQTKICAKSVVLALGGPERSRESTGG